MNLTYIMGPEGKFRVPKKREHKTARNSEEIQKKGKKKMRGGWFNLSTKTQVLTKSI